MTDSKERAHVYISGNVQGVFFRGSTQQKAEELGVVGWVKNMPDGRVEAVFEGSPDAVQGIIEWCKEGPSYATVEHVDADREQPQEDFSRFEVR
ncbi:acylphosphatase [soil metagenome]